MHVHRYKKTSPFSAYTGAFTMMLFFLMYCLLSPLLRLISTVGASSSITSTPLRQDWEHELVSCMGQFNKQAVTREYINSHYLKLMNATKSYRNLPIHKYSKYNGPWIENLWIERFSEKIKSANNDVTAVFPGSVVPLFIQWTDFRVTRTTRFPYKVVQREIFALLDPKILYVTVSQHDAGIFPLRPIQNIFIFSSGGVGHVPIPLLSATPPLAPRLCGGVGDPPCLYSASFFGQVKFGDARVAFNEAMQPIVDPSIRCCRSDPLWQEVMTNSTVALTPRGYGRTSYRISEAIHMGVLPVHIYDDVNWLPYKQSPVADFELFGFVTHISNFTKALGPLKTLLTPEVVSRRREIMLSLRTSHFTFEGVLQQIELYLQHGPHASDLRCEQLTPFVEPQKIAPPHKQTRADVHPHHLRTPPHRVT